MRKGRYEKGRKKLEIRRRKMKKRTRKMMDVIHRLQERSISLYDRYTPSRGILNGIMRRRKRLKRGVDFLMRRMERVVRVGARMIVAMRECRGG